MIASPEDVVKNIAWVSNYTSILVDPIMTVTKVYEPQITEATIDNQPVSQPTAQRMLRFWQAYMSLRVTQDPRPAQRSISASQPVTQIRISTLVATLAIFLITLLVALVYRSNETRDGHGERLHLPSSLIGWIVFAAHARHRGESKAAMALPSIFIDRHRDLMLVAGKTDDGHYTARIMSPGEKDGPSSPLSTPSTIQEALGTHSIPEQRDDESQNDVGIGGSDHEDDRSEREAETRESGQMDNGSSEEVEVQGLPQGDERKSDEGNASDVAC